MAAENHEEEDSSSVGMKLETRAKRELNKAEMDTLNAINIHKAVEKSDTTAIKEYISLGGDLEARDWDDCTPLHVAAASGLVEIVELLTRNGASLDCGSKLKHTPLHLASRYGHLMVTSILLSMGGTVDARDVEGNTPLHKAASNGQTAVCRELVKRGADVCTRNNADYTPLHWAAFKGHKSAAEQLLKCGADINSLSWWNSSALFISSFYGHVDVTMMLLAWGADPSLPNNEGHKAGEVFFEDVTMSKRAATVRLFITREALLYKGYEAIRKNASLMYMRAEKSSFQAQNCKAEVDALWDKLEAREKELNKSKVGVRDLSYAVKAMKTALNKSRIEMKTQKSRIMELEAKLEHAEKELSRSQDEVDGTRERTEMAEREIKRLGHTGEKTTRARAKSSENGSIGGGGSLTNSGEVKWSVGPSELGGMFRGNSSFLNFGSTGQGLLNRGRSDLDTTHSNEDPLEELWDEKKDGGGEGREIYYSPPTAPESFAVPAGIVAAHASAINQRMVKQANKPIFQRGRSGMWNDTESDTPSMVSRTDREGNHKDSVNGTCHPVRNSDAPHPWSTGMTNLLERTTGEVEIGGGAATLPVLHNESCLSDTSQAEGDALKASGVTFVEGVESSGESNSNSVERGDVAPTTSSTLQREVDRGSKAVTRRVVAVGTRVGGALRVVGEATNPRNAGAHRQPDPQNKHLQESVAAGLSMAGRGEVAAIGQGTGLEGSEGGGSSIDAPEGSPSGAGGGEVGGRGAVDSLRAEGGLGSNGGGPRGVVREKKLGGRDHLGEGIVVGLSRSEMSQESSSIRPPVSGLCSSNKKSIDPMFEAHATTERSFEGQLAAGDGCVIG